MNKHWLNLKYTLHHKWLVFIECVQMGIPLRGIIHDWTKFLPREWNAYATHFFSGDASSKTDKMAWKIAGPEFELAWNHHQKKNDHHWQFWVRLGDDGTVLVLPMSHAARREMLADWRGAGRARGLPNTWEWYVKVKDNIQLHPDTRKWLVRELEWQYQRYQTGYPLEWLDR